MLKLALIPIGAAVPALFFGGLSLYASLPTALCVCLSVLLFLPTVLLFLCDLIEKKRARKYVQNVAEAIVVPHLYLLIFLLADAMILFLSRFAELPVSLPLLFAVSGGLYMTAIVAGILHARVLKIRNYRLSLPTRGVSRRLRVLVFSDLHLGFFTTKALLCRLQKAITEQKPDLILFAGDLFDSNFSVLRQVDAAKEVLSSLTAPLGFYMCEGNHDRYSEGEKEKDAFLAACGLTVLRDECLSLRGLDLCGRLDRMKKDRLPASAFEKKGDAPLVILDHQPNDAEALIDAGADLVICGHTHNGQTFPGNMLAQILGKYNFGLHAYKNGYVLTSAGCGYWGLPMRLFTSNEVTVLDLELN